MGRRRRCCGTYCNSPSLCGTGGVPHVSMFPRSGKEGHGDDGSVPGSTGDLPAFTERRPSRPFGRAPNTLPTSLFVKLGRGRGCQQSKLPSKASSASRGRNIIALLDCFRTAGATEASPQSPPLPFQPVLRRPTFFHVTNACGACIHAQAQSIQVYLCPFPLSRPASRF